MDDLKIIELYENFYPPIYKGVKQNKFFLKNKEFTIYSKNRFRINSTHFIWNENRYIFPVISKNKKYLLSLIME